MSKKEIIYEPQGYSVKAKILAIDVGGTAIKSGVWIEGKLFLQKSVTTPKDLASFVSAIELLKISVETVYGKLEGLSFSLPGAVDTLKGQIGGVSAVPYIHGFPFVEYMEYIFKCPVCIENDANCAALAELTAGGAKNVHSAIIIVVGSGIGGALIIDKNIVKGRHLFGGEFGYMQLNEEHTFSQAASPVHHARRYSLEKGLKEEITGQQLFNLSLAKDHLAKKSVDYLKDSLARGIFNAMMVVDPDCVLIGGAIVTRSGFVEEIEQRVNHYLVQNRAIDVQTNIHPCSFSKEANVMGAVFNFIEVRNNL
ncbi:hypothetical protein A5886_001017 [Enterococcus sp. 8G7_MSG3316]|uniref:ROK family protein n=1 Tax=Candidatus Enterococcus testudinis TaxID=1834191 RepID=A0A242A5D0_9ENTE|nr:ROK family protein [Enterococcus sp. 8G7_MSG3316]OTN75941.1 hypothetical protein A5886_001017 [Enterococcus sp. 8G7_MSG3316]